MSDKSATFAADFEDEATALATDGGGCPILKGEAAEHFLSEMEKTSRLAERGIGKEAFLYKDAIADEIQGNRTIGNRTKRNINFA